LRVEPLEDRLCPSSGHLLVGSFNTDSVLRYDETSGAFADSFVPSKSGGLRNPIGVVFGPDHNLYVTSDGQPDKINPGHNAVLRYDGSTGDFLGAFADDKSLTNPRSILFGPDGNLYVNNGFGTGAVLRFNGTTGAFLDNFVLTGTGGLDHPTSMVFGPDGTNDGRLDLYVGQGTDNSNILRFDVTTGAFKGVFVTSFAGGLSRAGGMVFGPDGNLYVASSDNGMVLRFQGPDKPNPGSFLGTVVSGLSSPVGLLFGPDASGDGLPDLYVTSTLVNGKTFEGEVLRYDWVTGAFLGTFVAQASGGLSQAFLMTFTQTDPTTLAFPSDENLTAASTAASPVNQSAPQPMGNRLTAVIVNTAVPPAEHDTVLPGEEAIEITIAEGIGPNQFAQRHLSEGQPPSPPILAERVGHEDALLTRTPARQRFASADHQTVDRLFADLNNNPLADVLTDRWVLGPAA
jgi:hypothetical protein